MCHARNDKTKQNNNETKQESLSNEHAVGHLQGTCACSDNYFHVFLARTENSQGRNMDPVNSE